MTTVPASEYTKDDLVNTVRVLGPWWCVMAERIDNPWALPGLAQLLHHQRTVLDTLASAVELPAELFRISLEGEHELSLATSLLRKRWTDHTRADLETCVDASLALLEAAGRVVATVHGPPVPTRGDVAGLFVSGGGVPKRGTDHVHIGPRGVDGDRQKTRRHHGRGWQALCLWSTDVVAELAQEGHPIIPGNAGENISIAGLDWASVHSGSRLRIGTVLAEVSMYALPCSQNAAWFINGDYERMHHRRQPGVSRLYASVVETGAVHVGDAVVLEP